MKRSPSLPPLERFQVYSPGDRQYRRRSEVATRMGPEESFSRGTQIVSWICRLVAAAIMIETLFFKFTGAPESVYIFSKMNLEAWWRYGQGVWELLACIFLLLPRT